MQCPCMWNAVASAVSNTFQSGFYKLWCTGTMWDIKKEMLACMAYT